MDKIDVNTKKLVLKCKENNTKFQSLVIASVANPKVLEIFDNNWIYQSILLQPKLQVKDLKDSLQKFVYLSFPYSFPCSFLITKDFNYNYYFLYFFPISNAGASFSPTFQ
jgi:hypothetical protein